MVGLRGGVGSRDDTLITTRRVQREEDEREKGNREKEQESRRLAMRLREVDTVARQVGKFSRYSRAFWGITVVVDSEGVSLPLRA